MRYIIGTKYQSCTIKVTVRAVRACIVWLEAYDSVLPETYFTRRFYEFKPDEEQTFFIQMPICGKRTYVEVYEHEKQAQESGSFEVVEIEKMNLPRQMDVVKMQDDNVRHFVRFAQRFAFNAAILPTYEERYYVSDKGGFRIRYSTVIMDTGKVIKTPARITISNHLIDVAKAQFVPLTVPARMCILCHEFSHLFMNEDMYNELEADLNGLIIYLGLGYPRIEAKEVFSTIKEAAPSEENETRYKSICKFIDEFDALNFQHL
jgi:hypothetical protein